ncbi:MAG: hypothetical protein ACFWUE_02190 [Xylanivirga thermophila]|jgi:hypothetical protein|uniref:hypothetical protein n=1 Tax=Xylanivirga thermophila TaxID=2496273 RepID=UPI0039F5BAA1
MIYRDLPEYKCEQVIDSYEAAKNELRFLTDKVMLSCNQTNISLFSDVVDCLSNDDKKHGDKMAHNMIYALNNIEDVTMDMCKSINTLATELFVLYNDYGTKK